MDGEEGRVRLAGRPGLRERREGKCAHVCQEKSGLFSCAVSVCLQFCVHLTNTDMTSLG